MEKLLELDSLTGEAADFLRVMIQAGYTILIGGGTGAGKTTFLNALSQYIPEDERVITIEDNAELQLQGLPNLVRLECRQANIEKSQEITIGDLLKTYAEIAANQNYCRRGTFKRSRGAFAGCQCRE